MIDDPDLRKLFQSENEEKIHHIEELLKSLDAESQNSSYWDELMRDVHTIKGSARMLKIQSIELLAHHFEELLDNLRLQKLQVTESLKDLMFDLLNAISSFVIQETEGIPSALDPAFLIEKIHQVQSTIKPIKTDKLESPVQKIFAKIAEPKFQISTIRINVEHINQLMSQVVELNVIRNRIEMLFEQIEDILSFWDEKKKYAPKPTTMEEKELFEKQIEDKLINLRNLAYDHIHKLDLISTSLVDDVRKLSLVPVSKLFELFQSSVREMAKSSGKEVELVILNKDVGIDRKIIEELKDPLMHILRNAISHGIEPEAIRKQLGKPLTGKIELNAKETEESVIIEITDDGAGLNIPKIKQKALDLYTEKELAKMSDDDINMLIFLPGFSTSQEVSAISGRGVGLDIVQKTVESLHGSLSVKSIPNEGSIFTIELPISYVTTRVILVKEDNYIFGIPTDMIVSCLLVHQTFLIENREIIYFEEQPYSVHRLSPQPQKIPPFPCLILKSDQKIAFIVDAILEEQKLVITTPNKRFIHIQGLIGTTILKNGDVSLILNPEGLKGHCPSTLPKG